MGSFQTSFSASLSVFEAAKMPRTAAWKASAGFALLPWLWRCVDAAKQYTASCDPFQTDDPFHPPWEKGCGCPYQTITSTLAPGASPYTSLVTSSGTTEVVVGTPKPFQTVTRYVHGSGSTATSTTTSDGTVYGEWCPRGYSSYVNASFDTYPRHRNKLAN